MASNSERVATAARWLGALSIGLAPLGVAACTDFDTTALAGAQGPSAAAQPAPGTAAQPAPSAPGSEVAGDDAPDCFEHPTSHFELINACTKALRVAKTPQLLLLEPDGSLPPL